MYKLTDGFAPIFAYLAEEGYLVHQEFREGSQHCQKGTPEFLKQAIDYACMITGAKLLVRLDLGNDAEDTLETLRKQKVDFVIKRNLRKENRDEWLETAQAFGEWRHPREGKTVYIGDTHRQCGEHTWRVIFEVTERTTDQDGQQLMFPEITISTYWTSLGPRQATPDEVIELYKKHGTSEQFHSEIKTDLNLERLPSGRFTVNALILTCGMVAYNALRLIGQNILKTNDTLPPEEKMPLRKKVKRRRLRSIIQDIMYFAGRVVRHARRWHLSLPLINRWRGVFKATYRDICQRNRRRTI